MNAARWPLADLPATTRVGAHRSSTGASTARPTPTRIELDPLVAIAAYGSGSSAVTVTVTTAIATP
ncbi:hypothetical protein [Nocardioides sp. TF02-7]|uniref:hypothetical protein n=1 Tax=Nocardioides sp. TF02-7 TaxID=2917724 RepID=UPI001F05A71E|nr:hypothetical protein [Nocardioides sp. TF02-7]UMG93227.1 hypothetical protein MF408_02710 [Nocardioides sp. TF02-7]